jgi:hypothetical protein
MSLSSTKDLIEFNDLGRAKEGVHGCFLDLRRSCD